MRGHGSTLSYIYELIRENVREPFLDNFKIIISFEFQGTSSINPFPGSVQVNDLVGICLFDNVYEIVAGFSDLFNYASGGLPRAMTSHPFQVDSHTLQPSGFVHN